MREFTGNVKLSEFALKLREIRIRKGISIEVAAKNIGISPALLFNYENDKDKPNKGTMRKIRTFYNIDKSELP